MECCHGAGLGATILSSGVGVLVVLWVSVAFRVTRMRCHGDNVSPVPFRSVRFFGCPRSSFEVLRIGNYCMDSVAIKALSILTVLVLFFFSLYAMSCILDRLSRI